MNIDKNRIEYNENDNILKEFLVAIWKHKLLIISFTIIVTILAGIYSLFLLPPIYKAKLNIIINMPENYHTEYGDYTFKLATNYQYLELITSDNVLLNTIKDMGYNTSVDQLKSSITIETIPITPIVSADPTVKKIEQNSFDIIVAAGDPEGAKLLAQTLFDNFKEYLDVMIAEEAINYYVNNFTININTLGADLEKNQLLLKQDEETLSVIPQTINLEDSLSKVQEQINTSKIIILENEINPNYVDGEKDIILIKQLINSTQNSISLNNIYLKELEDENSNVENYYQTGEYKSLDSSLVSIIDTNVFLPSLPIAPNHKSSPNNIEDILIGTMLGLMIGLLTAFVKEFWLKINPKL